MNKSEDYGSGESLSWKDSISQAHRWLVSHKLINQGTGLQSLRFGLRCRAKIFTSLGVCIDILKKARSSSKPQVIGIRGSKEWSSGMGSQTAIT